MRRVVVTIRNESDNIATFLVHVRSDEQLQQKLSDIQATHKHCLIMYLEEGSYQTKRYRK